MKKLMVLVATAAVALWLGASTASAQGQSQNHTNHGAAASGSHEPMGMDHAMGGGVNNGMGKSSTASGPKTADEMLKNNTQLSTRLASLLPTGTDLQTVAGNFRNFGLFVAAVHVSHNLNIPFACLASDMNGTAATNFAPPGATVNCPAGTGDKKMSLGSSIQALDPSVDKSQANQDAKTAMNEAKNDMKNK